MSPKEKLWPTPRSTDGHGVGKHGQGGLDLRTSVQASRGTVSQASDVKTVNGGNGVTADATMTQLPLLPEAFLANLLVPPGSERARKMTAGSGLKCLGLSERSDPIMLLQKMLLASSEWGSTIVYLTWRTKAIAPRRFLYQLVPSTPPTDGIESSLWATPRNCTSMQATINEQRAKHKFPNLETQVARTMFPTPSSQLAGEGELLEIAETVNGEKPIPNQRVYNPKTGKHIQVTLNRAVKMWPTPTGRDHKDTGDCANVEDNGLLGRVVNPSKESGSLNPLWVEWLQGFPPGYTDLKHSETP